MSYRVVQWSTGNVGRMALRGIIGHPDLELVGLWVHSAGKVGRDAGDLAGTGSVGVVATDDVDALLSLRPDCVCYTATADLRLAEAVEDIAAILRSGANVVSSSIVPLVEPHGAIEFLRDPIEAAAEEGRASFFTSGIDPGFANDLVPLVLTGVCERIERVRIAEILNYDTYLQPEVLFETMGFGEPPDHVPILLQPGVLGLAWGGTIRLLAEGLGVELDGIRETYERVTADEAFDIPTGRIEAGTVAALHFEVEGIVGGRPAIVVEHVTRLRDDLAPEWPQPARGGSYRVEIEGEPRITADVVLEGRDDGDHNTGGLVATAMRLVNAIPAVVGAPPGMLSTLDLPLTPGRHLLRP